MDQLATLFAEPSGAKFWRTDLHVHTPASRDVDGRWMDARPEDVVEQALLHGLETIAITDHNSVAWCDAVRAAPATTELRVFPGVEISTSEGHLLGIFERDKPAAEIREFLVQVNLRKNAEGDLEVIADTWST